MSLEIHPHSRRQLENMMQSLPQSLLLTGEVGVGLFTVARHMAGKNLHSILQPQNIKEEVDLSAGTISVEAIRRLYQLTQGKYTSPQVVIIDNADKMNHSGQSAFLKLLEEPNKNVHFILTSHKPSLLQLTILSRVQVVSLRKLEAEQTEQFISRLGVTDQTQIARLQFIAAGLPAELTRLHEDETYFTETAAVVSDARTFLQGTTYDRLLIAHAYQADRPKALQLISFAQKIARKSLSAKPQQQLVSQLDALSELHKNISNNCNVKLQLVQFVL